ncbi:hypothetical protein GGR42_002927 [Saonia flava]|uniref:Glycosyltransferase 2-like domain-containing protein n=1 Tax=Saonia flava TaxID=523696 RepID=A0A846QTZ8_9FLAO|nr:glycosyltransferase [Saonia flava]NJB72436.1 hypothetical protein [Saonia flava]
MKVKEIPVSLFHTCKLLMIPSKKIKSPKSEKIPVIISLTSIPSRIPIVHITIRSLLFQSVTPDKIILWLHKDLKQQLPKKLKNLEGDIFEIRFSELTCSHRKLIHPLEFFPSNIIITCDDDMIYSSNWLKRLYKEHKKFPKDIIANQTRYINYNLKGELLPYKKWTKEEGMEFNQQAVLPIGAGGVLYPSKSLSDMATDQNLFLKLTPKADDLWFKAMSLLKGTCSRASKQSQKKPIPILGSQIESLKKNNVDNDKNRIQWLAVSEHFKLNLHK